MLRWLGLLLLVLLIGLQLKLWVGDGGMREVRALHGHVAEQRQQNEQLKRRNQALAADVDDLKHGDQAVEARARSDLGLIRPGEVYYQVGEPAPAASAGGRP
jgi:cell division protein FtsB